MHSEQKSEFYSTISDFVNARAYEYGANIRPEQLKNRLNNIGITLEGEWNPKAQIKDLTTRVCERESKGKGFELNFTYDKYTSYGVDSKKSEEKTRKMSTNIKVVKPPPVPLITVY